MKDIVIITSYCDTEEKETVLRNLINDFDGHRDSFDIMVVSHLPIPYDISQKVNFAFYDEKNELLYDTNLRSTPWFNPGDERAILSCYTGNFNTHLAIWRMLILGNIISKSCGYKKAHHIEYDCSIKHLEELYNNSKLLDEYDAVVYNKIVDTVDPILFGTYQAYNLTKLHHDLLFLDENKIKSIIKDSEHKSPEKMLFELLNHNNNVILKNKNILESNNNEFGMSHNKISNGNTAWCLPFYDRLTKKLGFVIWNMEEHNKDIEVQVIYNDDKVFNFGYVPSKHWRLIDIDDFSNAKKMVVILNNKIRNVYNFEVDGENFKNVSYRQEFVR